MPTKKKNSSSKKATVEIDSLLTLLQDINFNLLEIKKDLAELKARYPIVINNYPKQEPPNFVTKPQFFSDNKDPTSYSTTLPSHPYDNEYPPTQKFPSKL